ncbi:chromate transporter [Anaerobacillus alkalilacustris]|uniref:Chromate transporter n=1 Tax=Anaerobacillus alkalilacustris TaxID=393763 RepID=A0A1S2LHS4_9BACI|nr:chromate transporter [Anaerobacillus alkalilacustris]OIJ12078.1 chromate transporter [Anaerobacillus alkalilacustris]
MKTLVNIFIAFFRSGMLGYGGGPSSIPLVHKEVVETFKWMSDDEFSDVLAIGNTLPGPINTKMAGYIGYRVAGLTGMLTAIIASIVPTIILMIVLLTSLSKFKDEPWVAGITKGVIPVVAVMLAVLAWQFFQKSKEGLGWGISILLLVASLSLIEFLNIHPGIVIALLLSYALLKPNAPTKDHGQKERSNVQ